MNYLTLKIIHIVGLSLTFMGLAGVLAVRMMEEVSFRKRLIFQAAYGLGLLLLIGSGIAMTLQLGQWVDQHSVPGWVKAKFGIWLLAGAAMGLAVRFGGLFGGRFAGLLLVFFTLLVAVAAWLAINKPF